MDFESRDFPGYNPSVISATGISVIGRKMAETRISFPFRWISLSVILAVYPASTAIAQSKDFALLGAFIEAIDKTKPDSGLHIIYVIPGSAGDEMGLKVGDEIISLNDSLISNRKQLIRMLRQEEIGSTIRFLVKRAGETIQIKGRIGSYLETMGKIQERHRKQYVGKPLATLPETLWWNRETMEFGPGKDLLAGFKGRIGLLVAYDDCRGCQKYRVEFLSQLFTRTKADSKTLPLAFAGIYQSDQQLRNGGSRQCLTGARILYETKKPAFRAGIAHFPKGMPTPKEREKYLYLHGHGVVITDPDGKVAYLQTTGYPDQEAIQKTIGELILKHFQPPAKPGKK
jgi:hypothetical protein